MKYGCQSMVDSIRTIMIKKPQHAFISQEHLRDQYEDYNYIGMPDYDEVISEYRLFEDIISKHVDNIIYMPFDNRAGLDSIYTHDSVKITRKGAIYMNMGKALRKAEAQATEELLESMGIPTLGHIKDGGTMEGGDVVWLDDKTVAIGLGYRTNKEGINQFRKLVQDFVDEIIVVPLPHADGPEACLHLMSIISMVDNDLAVVYSKYMPVQFRNMLIDRGIELLEVNDDEYDNLGSNVLAIGPRICMLLEGNPDIENKLIKAGATTYLYKGDELSYKGTGGPTCLTCPITRG